MHYVGITARLNNVVSTILISDIMYACTFIHKEQKNAKAEICMIVQQCIIVGIHTLQAR